MIDGKEAVSACYFLAGAVGVEVEGKTLRVLWQMWAGKMHSVRLQCFWQATLVWGMDKIDLGEFMRRGTVGAKQANRVTMSPKLEQAVREEQGRMNRERAEREGRTFEVISGKPC